MRTRVHMTLTDTNGGQGGGAPLAPFMFSEKGHAAAGSHRCQNDPCDPSPRPPGHTADQSYCGWASVGSIHLQAMTNACPCTREHSLLPRLKAIQMLSGAKRCVVYSATEAVLLPCTTSSGKPQPSNKSINLSTGPCRHVLQAYSHIQ